MVNELVKQLKDAGFPWKEEYERGADPTLEELIEACVSQVEHGDFHLEHLHDQWSASTCWQSESDWCHGATPTEAVARLWLALNTK